MCANESIDRKSFHYLEKRAARYLEDGELAIIGDQDCMRVSLHSMQALNEVLGFRKESIVFVDVETTGLNPKRDEILQVSMCDGNGKTLFNSYVRPENRVRWPKAQAINHISWDMVKDAPSLLDLSNEIEEVLYGHSLIIGYNLKFDLEFLRAGHVAIRKYWTMWDILPDCSVAYGKEDLTKDYFHTAYVRMPLKNIASNYGIEYKAHDSIEDAIATSKVFYSMLKDENYIRCVLENESEEDRLLKRVDLEAQSESTTKTNANNNKKRSNFNTGCLVLLATIILAIVLMLGSCMATCRSTHHRHGFRGYSIFKTR